MLEQIVGFPFKTTALSSFGKGILTQIFDICIINEVGKQTQKCIFPHN